MCLAYKGLSHFIDKFLWTLVFGKYYVKTGLASPEDGRLYSQLESLREKSDYDILFRATEEDVAPMLPRVTLFLDTIHNLLNHNKN